MRKLFLILLSMGQIWAQSNPTLYVASLKGLSLREGPSKESKKVELLPYGKEINNYMIPEGKPVVIDGYSGKWINVLTHEGKSYYVFDGYTLPFEIPKDGKILNYFKRIFGEMISEDSVIHKSDGEIYESEHTYKFSSGVVFIDFRYNEGYGYKLENLDLNVQKSYLFYYLLSTKMGYGDTVLDKIDYPTKTHISDTLNVEFNKKDYGDLWMERTYGATTYLRIISNNGKTTMAWGAGL